MTDFCDINLGRFYELVLADTHHAKTIHMELYRFSESSYFVSNNIIQGLSKVKSKITDIHSPVSRLHIVSSWENLLILLVNKNIKPNTKELFIHFQSAGISRQDLLPFMDADINDIFTWLYYAKRLDVLKKICHAVKRRVNTFFNDKLIRIDCHLVANDIKHIIASSL